MRRRPRSTVYFIYSILFCLSCGSPSGPKIGPPAVLTISAGSAQTGEVAAILPTNLAVKVADASGNGVPNTAVTWTTVGGTVTPVSATTDNSGVAEAKWTLGPAAGTQSVTAAAVGLTAITLTATARAGAASKISKATGDAQNATVAAATSAQPTVIVEDRFGNAVSGATATWTTSGGATVSAATSVSDAQGLARTTWQMGTLVGTYRLNAAVAGTTPLEFTATAQAGAAAAVTVVQNVSTAEWGNTLQYSATAADAFGNAVIRTPSWSSSNTNIATVNASGLVSTLRAGSTAVTATLDGRIGSANLNVTALNMKISVKNTLTLGITVKVAGAAIGTVDAYTTKEFTIPTRATLAVDWDIIRQRRSDGVAIGDIFGGVYDPFVPTFREPFTVDYTVGNDTYFAPFIDNNSTSDWLMVVNFGNQYENRCNCVVLHGVQDVFLGYYRWIPTTNVRAYRSASSYTGTFTAWADFSQFFGLEDGGLTLFSDLNPQLVSMPGEVMRNRAFNPASVRRDARTDRAKIYTQDAAPLTIAPISAVRN